MIPCTFYLNFPDYRGAEEFFTYTINADVVREPKQGEDFQFGNFDAHLSDEAIRELAEMINDSLAAESYIGRINNKGPADNYKDEVLDWLKYAIWHVEYILLTCKCVEVTLMLTPGNPDYKRPSNETPQNH